jgi:uncharacterized membrane protein
MKMRISRAKLVLLMVMSVFGLWASSMVVVVYWLLKSTLPLCSPTPTYFAGVKIDCNAVLGSVYSQVFGVPLELFAVAYFVINILLVCLVAFGSESVFRRALTILFGWRFIGLIIVPYLVSIELFIIQAICVYCTIMHVAIILDFIIITYFLYYKKNSLYNVTDSGVSSLPT